MTTPRIAAVFWPALVVTFVAAASAIIGLSLRSGGMTLTPFGCAEFHREAPNCELQADRSVRIFLELPSKSRELGPSFSVRAGFSVLPESAVDVSLTLDGYLLKLTLPPNADEVVVSARRGLWPVGRKSLRFREPSEPKSVQSAYDSWQRNEVAAAETALLRVVSQPNADARTLARAHYILGRIHSEKREFDAAMRDLDAALALAQKAGILTTELYTLLEIGNLRLQKDHSLLALRKDLPAGWQKRLEQSIELRPWVKLFDAQMYLYGRDLIAAQQALIEGMRWAERLQLGMARDELDMLRTQFYTSLAQSSDAAIVLRNMAVRNFSQSPCRQVISLYNQGELRLQAFSRLSLAERKARLAQPKKSAAVLAQHVMPAELAEDPQPFFEEALGIMDKDKACDVKAYRDHVLLLMFQRALLTGDAATISAAEAVVSEPGDDEKALWLDLKGQSALFASNLKQARELFIKLEAYAVAWQHWEFRFRALIGQARSWEVESPEQAEALYKSAQELVQNESAKLPLGAAIEGFLTEYGESTGRYLALLLRQNRVSEAWLLFRRARTRPFRGLLHLAKNRETVATYRKIRDDLDKKTREQLTAPTDEGAVLEEQKRALFLDLGALERRAIEEVPAAMELSTRAADELLIGCYPLPDETACFMDDGDVAVTRLLRLDPQMMSKAELANSILVPFKKKLERALAKSSPPRIRVFAYGALRQVDLALLPLKLNDEESAHPLGERFEILYGLDIPDPLARLDAKASHDALEILDPTAELDEVTSDAAAITQALSTRGWHITTVLHGEERGAGNAQTPLSLIEKAEYFYFAGHGASSDDMAGLKLGASGLLPSDVMYLARVPHSVVLIGCSTGISANPFSTGPDGFGVAEAFVLRGSRQVLATVRPISQSLAVELGRFLHRQPSMQAAHIDLAAAFFHAVFELRQKKAQAQTPAQLEASDEDFGAFRVYSH